MIDSPPPLFFFYIIKGCYSYYTFVSMNTDHNFLWNLVMLIFKIDFIDILMLLTSGSPDHSTNSAYSGGGGK